MRPRATTSSPLGDEFFGDEVNVESFIETGEKALEHVLEALEMAAADGHPFWHIVDDVRRLETAQRLSMARHGSFVECADALLVVLDHVLFLHVLTSCDGS